jgi:hypothetical protein
MKKLLLVVAVTLLAGCATRMQSRSDHDASQDFTRYHTYAWVADEPMIAADGKIDGIQTHL